MRQLHEVRNISVRLVRDRMHAATLFAACRVTCVYARYRYKILFMVLGLVGLYFTRGLYTDREVTYVPRGRPLLACECCGFRTDAKSDKADKE